MHGTSDSGRMRTRIWERIAVGFLLVTGSCGCQSTGPRNAAAAHFDERGGIDAASVADRDPRTLPMFDGRSGVDIDWNGLLERAAAVEVIILGEQHDDAVAHAVQLAVTQDIAARFPGAGALSLEMLERDEQCVTDDYIEGLIDAASFATLTDSETWAGEGSWRNWYQPIIDAAAMNGWAVIAANAPRRYVRLARTTGYDRLRSLPPARREFISLPRSAPHEYYQRFREVMARGHAAGTQPATAPASTPATAASTETAPANMRVDARDGFEPGFLSQLLWDATMADSIARARRRGASKVIHLVGQFHSDFTGGTVQELRVRQPSARILVISMQRAEGESLREEDRSRADIVVYTGARPATSGAETSDQTRPAANAGPAR